MDNSYDVSVDCAAGCLCLVLHCAVYFSNSYVVHLDSVAVFLLTSLSAAFFLTLISSATSLAHLVTSHINKQFIHPMCMILIVLQRDIVGPLASTLGLGVLARVVKAGPRACREEQVVCVPGPDLSLWILTLLLGGWVLAMYWWMHVKSVLCSLFFFLSCGLL